MQTEDLIRSARQSDAAALLEIYGPVVRDSVISFEFEPPSEMEFTARIARVQEDNPWLVLERDGQIAGYAYATEFRARPAYAATRETTVYVHSDYQRSGVGRALMLALLGELAVEGARVAVAVIALPNAGSVALHEALGFEHAGTLHGVGRKFGRWHDEGFWEVALDVARFPSGDPESSV